jgi:ubiquinone/menaquinone biosynthesis C-methylase UbiE
MPGNSVNIIIMLLVLLLIVASMIIWYVNYHQNISNSLIPKDVKTILDLGCGDCCRSVKNKEITYIDIVNKSKCNKPIIYDGSKIPLPDKSIDIVIVSFVLHHVNDQDKLIKEIFRVARKYVLINEDTPSNGIQSYFNRLHAGYGEWGTNYNGFHSLKWWYNKLSSYGKVLVNSIYVLPVMRNFPFIYYTDRTSFLVAL